jgi:Nuclease-related domain
MIIKERTIPLQIEKLQALISRTPPSHPKIQMMNENLSKRLSGFKGETYLDYPLSFLSDKDYYILHGLRINNDTHFFQMDSFIISTKILIILEVKNIAGDIYLDPIFHQLIRMLDGKETVFEDPIIQINRQELQLKKWLRKHQFPNIPILSLVVFTHPKALLRTSPENLAIPQKVVHRNFLSTKLSQLETEYSEECISIKDIKRMIKLLKKQHKPLDQPILEQYGIGSDELCKGVFCPACHHLPMERLFGTWNCPKCMNKEKNAHISALKDYFLLCGSEITNEKARDFLQISSPYLASRLLHSMKLPSDGTTKNRIYHLSFMK